MSENRPTERTVSSDEIERAWKYHAAADELLHSRTEAYLIAHAFLAVGYFQILSTDLALLPAGFFRSTLEVVIIITALSMSGILIVANKKISNGLRYLKQEYLQMDNIYKGYMSEVYIKPRLISFWLPSVFLFYWLMMAVYYIAKTFGSE